MKNIDVSIILVNYKTKDLTIDCINSIYDKTSALNFEIFVVDNASNDGSIEAIEQEFPNINIIKNPVNAGFSAANNLGIRRAAGKYVLCLNTDTLLINNAVKIMFDFMEQPENSNVGVCGGSTFDEDNKPCGSGAKFPLPRLALIQRTSRWLKKVDVEWILGADIFFRKSVLDEIGAFDERFFMCFEEIDLCKRIKDAGYDVKVATDAKIIHFGGGSSPNRLQSAQQGKISQLIYIKKHYGVFAADTHKWSSIIQYLIDWLIKGDKNAIPMLKNVWGIRVNDEHF